MIKRKIIMKLKTIVISTAIALASAGATADQAQVNFTSSVATYCTVGQVTPGVMHVEGTTVSTDTPAVMFINTNEAATYKIAVTNPGDFATKPTGFAGVASINSSYNVDGANVAGPFGPGVEYNLDNLGGTNMNISIDGTIDIASVAGDYTAVAIASCVPQ